jgi:hypothetical protein
MTNVWQQFQTPAGEAVKDGYEEMTKDELSAELEARGFRSRIRPRARGRLE